LALSELPAAGGTEYAQGLRNAVAVAIHYGIGGIAHCEASSTVPVELLGQARRAAASGVGLDTVLRRYLAGHALLGDFLMEEAERAENLAPAELKRLLRLLAAGADRILAAVSEAYAEEARRRGRGAEHRRTVLVERLLAGEPLDPKDLAYDLNCWHLGVVVSGPGAQEASVSLARSFDTRQLVLSRDRDLVWVWLGGRDPIDPRDACSLAEATSPPGVALALGEPGEGLAGWRLTHQQARAAIAVAQRGPRTLVRYADVALLAATVRDELLDISLRKLYLEPLEGERDGGVVLKETLRAYFRTERNVSSAASALGVNRNTITNRLRAVEQRLGHSLATCGADLEVALRLAEVSGRPSVTQHTAGPASTF
jgi:DNA-binding PucR family transcriptional regulator